MTFHDFTQAWISFALVAIASAQVSLIFPLFGLPLITGYMFFGMAAGPEWLELVRQDDLPYLVYITQFALAFISLSAGAELYLPELRSLFKRILTITGAVTVVTFVTCVLVIFGLSQTALIPFMHELHGDFNVNACRFSISLIAGSIMVTQSPASAIAVVSETKAKGPFTSTMLGITVLTDVVVLLIYSVAASIANAECDPASEGFSVVDLLLTAFCIVMAIGIGWAIGKLIVFCIWLPTVPGSYLVLPLGFGIFQFSTWFLEWTTEKYGHGVNFDPLLICITAGYVVANQSRNRRKFLRFLSKVGPIVFIPFFTLTGAALKLGVVFRSLGFAVIVFAVRALCFAIGSYAGGHYAGGMPERHKRTMWSSMLTQAGVSLGIAAEVALAFPSPEWGNDFQSTVISVILFNQVVGPILCKWAIKHNGEAGLARDDEEDEHEHASGGASGGGALHEKPRARCLVFGVTPYSLSTIQRLLNAGWNVLVCDEDASKEASLAYLKQRPEKKQQQQKTLTDSATMENPFALAIAPEDAASPTAHSNSDKSRSSKDYSALPLAPSNASSASDALASAHSNNYDSHGNFSASAASTQRHPQLTFRHLNIASESEWESNSELHLALQTSFQTGDEITSGGIQSTLVALSSDAHNYALAAVLCEKKSNTASDASLSDSATNSSALTTTSLHHAFGLSNIVALLQHPAWGRAFVQQLNVRPVFAHSLIASTLSDALLSSAPVEPKDESAHPSHHTTTIAVAASSSAQPSLEQCCKQFDPELTKEEHERAAQHASSHEAALLKQQQQHDGLASEATRQIEQLKASVSRTLVQTLTRSGGGTGANDEAAAVAAEEPHIVPFYMSATNNLNEELDYLRSHPPPSSDTLSALTRQRHGGSQSDLDSRKGNGSEFRLNMQGEAARDPTLARNMNRANATFAGIMLNGLEEDDEAEESSTRAPT